MKENIKIHEKFAYSFYKFSAYKNFITQGLFKAILYIFAVTVLFTTLSNYSVIKVFNDDYSRIERQFDKYSPEFELKDSKLNVHSDNTITYNYTGDSLIISLLLNDNIVIDTKKAPDSSVLDKYDSGMYVNQDSLVIKQFGSIMNTFNYSDFEGLTLNKESFSKALSHIKYIFDFAILFGTPIFAFLSNLLAVFLFIGPMTVLIARNFRLKLSYTQGCTLGLYSMTLPIFLEALSVITGYSVPSFGIFFYLLTLCYCTLVINTFVNMRKNSINDLV